MKKYIFVLFLLLPFYLSGQNLNDYKVDVNINGLRDSAIYLAYHFGNKQYISDTVNLDNNGHGVFTGNSLLPQGIYMIVLPGKKYFELLMSDDQNFTVNCDYNDFIGTLKFSGSDENSAFIDYQKKWVKLQQKASSIGKRLQRNKQNKDSLRILSSLQKRQEDKMKEYLKSVISANKGNLLSVLVSALLPVNIPQYNPPAAISNPDSARWVWNYNYNVNHYFDNINLKDERLLRTPILYGKLNTFFTNVLIQSPDTINKVIDKLIKKVEGDYKIFQFVSVFLFNHFRESQIMGQDAVMVKIADDIYLSGKANWVSDEFKRDLKREIDLIRPNLIGKKAVNLVMDSYRGVFVSLDDINKDFTILYFWEPDCGHCQEATPKLKAYYDKPKDYSLEVFAVCTTDDKPQWTKYIETNKLTWINGWDPDRSSHFDYYYNVQSTPTVYILDKNKKIIAKKLSVEEISSFIDNYRKYYRPLK